MLFSCFFHALSMLFSCLDIGWLSFLLNFFLAVIVQTCNRKDGVVIDFELQVAGNALCTEHVFALESDKFIFLLTS